MLQISVRGQSMPQSPIRKLVPYAEEAKRKGIKVIHLNIGQPDIPTAPLAIEAMHKVMLKVVEYSHSAGNETYRKKLVSFYRKWNIDVSYNDILVTTGGSEAIRFAYMSCFDVGDEIIIPEPFYANYNSFAAEAGIKIIPITSTIKNGFALPPIGDFEKHITPRTRGIMLSNPNNPTGYLYSISELEQLRDIVKKHNLYLISDEVYRIFCYDGNPFMSAMLLKGIENNVILIDSISKIFSSCGIRIGTLITKNKEVLQTAMKFAMARLSPPSFGQIAGEAILDTPDEYYREEYNSYLQRRNYVIDALNKIQGVYCPMPKGAFYAIARLPVDDADVFAKWLLSDFKYNNQTVMLAPASGFYATPGLGKNEVRIAYVINVDDLKNAVKCIEEALKVYPGRIK